MDSALQTFWEKGFELTSIQDIVAATGVNRASLYNTFGDKNELFSKAFNQYCRRVEARIEEVLLQNAPVADILVEYKRSLKEANALSVGKGCMIVATVVSADCPCAKVQERAKEMIAKRDQALEVVFQRGQREGAVNTRHTPKILAQMFHSAIVGLAVLDKSRVSHGETDAVIDMVFETLK